MSLPYLGEIRQFAFDFAPQGWALCNGQLLPIAQNQALFSILGTTYGGDGKNTFALPDLRGRTPLHTGEPRGGESHVLGQKGGEESHALTIQEMAQHTHVPRGSGATVDSNDPAGRVLGVNQGNPYANLANVVPMSAAMIAKVGGSQPHLNMQPYLVFGFAIALQGTFPTHP